MTLPQQDEIYSKVRPEPGGTIARFKVRCLLSGILERSRWRKVVVHLPHQIRDKDENDENHYFVDDGRDGFFQDVLLGEFRKHGALDAGLALLRKVRLVPHDCLNRRNERVSRTVLGYKPLHACLSGLGHKLRTRVHREK